MRDPDDEELWRRFAELRAHDRSRTPAFEAMLGAARSRASVRRSRAPLLAAAAVLVLIAAGAALLTRFHPRAPRVATASLSAWRSPTASLLRMPGDAMLYSVPSVSASVVNLEPAAPVRSTSE